jgi:tetratricopeptide (TPR) repeat protein
LLADTDRLREALSVIARTLAAESQHPTAHYFHAKMLWANGRLDEAEQALASALARWPRHVLLWFAYFWFLTYTGRPAAALSFINDSDGRPDGVPESSFHVAVASARALVSGSPADLQDAISKHRKAARQGTAYAESAVSFFSATRSLDDAYRVLGNYYSGAALGIAQNRFGPETATYTPPDKRDCGILFAPECAALRSDPRFEQLLRDVGLEDYWRQTGTVPDYRRTSR